MRLVLRKTENGGYIISTSNYEDEDYREKLYSFTSLSDMTAWLHGYYTTPQVRENLFDEPPF